MQLESGLYFGEVRVSARVNDARLAVTEYSEQDQPWHTHENPTLFVHLRGDHCDELPAGSFEQPVLSIVYHPAEVEHKSRVGPSGMTGLNIELTPEWMSAHEIQDAHLGRERLVQSPASCCAAVSLLDALYGSATVDRDNALLDLAAGVTSDATERYEPVWLNAAKHYADEVGSDTSIRQIAREIGVHPVHLSRVFRAVTGTTFCAYLQKGRLRYATSLLFKGLSAGEAAIEAGFGDQFYMSRCFRRQFGMSPRRVTELRKMLSA